MLGMREYTLCLPFRANAHNSSYNYKMFFGLFLGGFISQVASCMGGLIKQGPLYTTYAIIMITTTQQSAYKWNDLVWEKSVYYQQFIRLFLYHVRELSARINHSCSLG